MHKLSRLAAHLIMELGTKRLLGRYVCGALAMYPYPETLIVEVVTMTFFAKYRLKIENAFLQTTVKSRAEARLD